MSSKIKGPRGWQQAALEKFFKTPADQPFLIDACPGSGKTIFSALCARDLMEENAIDFSIIVVPTTAIKGDATGGFLSDWHLVGITIKTSVKEGRGMPRQFKGITVTYQQLPNLVNTFETWVRNGARLFFVFDEVHHATEMNVWGTAAERCAQIGTRILCMTGTPFRGDGSRISFVRYDSEGKCIADNSYTYKQAVWERVCRPVEFIKDDSITQYVLEGELTEVRVSEANQTNEGPVKATLYSKDSNWMQGVIAKAESKLDEYRQSDLDAGGIVICRPGTDENDDRHLEQIAKLVKTITGENPTVIKHDDPDANAKISRFRKSNERWICAVRKISEGVDIKRLRVMVMATAPQTELLFRQLVGRVVRQEDETKLENATVYISSLPRLREFAGRIEDEAIAGLNEREPKPRENGDREEHVADFASLDASHLADGAISHWGEQFTAPEIDFADRVKTGDPVLRDVSVTQIAHILKKQGVDANIESAEDTEPELTRRLRLRQSINRKARRIAISNNQVSPDFKAVWARVYKLFGVRSLDDLIDNQDYEIVQQVDDFLSNRLAHIGQEHAA